MNDSRAMSAPAGGRAVEGARMPAMRIERTTALEDGHTAVVRDLSGDDVLFIGTRPLPEHRAEARRIVREGMADILAWLGEPVELPTGDHRYACLRGFPDVRGSKLPTSTRAFPSDEHWLYTQRTATNWAVSALESLPIPAPTHVLHAQKYGHRVALPPLEMLVDLGGLADRVRNAIVDTYVKAGIALRRDGMVADVTDGYPLPDLAVELRFKAWPAVPGVTTSESTLGEATDVAT